MPLHADMAHQHDAIPVVELDSNELLRLATELEGHPDNVAPALFGGLTIAWVTPEGPQFKKLIVHRMSIATGCLPTLTPGELHVNSDAIVAGCGNSSYLVLEEVQLEGKKRMPAADFLHGYQVKAGEVLG